MNNKRTTQINNCLKRTTKVFPLRLHRVIDADILNKLDEQPSKAGYIKRLIRQDMEMKQNE